METFAIDASSYDNCAELKKKTPTPTATTEDGFVHFAPVAMSDVDYLQCGGGEDLNSSLIMMASPRPMAAAEEPAKSIGGSSSNALRGEYVTIAGSPATYDRHVRGEYVTIAGSPLAAPSPVSASSPAYPYSPASDQQEQHDDSYIAIIGTPQQQQHALSSMDGEYLMICTPEPSTPATADAGTSMYDGGYVIQPGTVGYVEKTPQGQRFIIPTMRKATPPDASSGSASSSSFASGAASSSSPATGRRVLRKAVFRAGPGSGAGGYESAGFSFDPEGLGDVGVVGAGVGQQWRELPSPQTSNVLATTKPYTPESSANRRARRRRERKAATEAEALAAEAGNRATNLKAKKKKVAPPPTAAKPTQSNGSAAAAAEPVAPAPAEPSPVRPPRKKGKSKAASTPTKASSLRSVETARTPVKSNRTPAKISLLRKVQTANTPAKSSPLAARNTRQQPQQLRPIASTALSPPALSVPAATICSTSRAKATATAKHAQAVEKPQKEQEAEQVTEEENKEGATPRLQQQVEDEPAPTRPKRKISKRAAAAAAMFEQAAVDASKTKKSAGRKSLSTIAASPYRSRAASMFEAREQRDMNAAASTSLGGIAKDAKSRPRAVSASVPSSKMKDLQVMAAGALASQHEEGDSIDAHIAAVAANSKDIVSFRIGNAQTFKRLDTAERNAKFDEIVDALSINTVVTDITMSNCGGNDYLAEELADMLLTNTTVTALNLDSNDIRGDGIIALADMLYTNTTLAKLKLANQIKAVPTKALHKMAKAVRENTTITVCSVKCHDATARERLEAALRRNTDLLRQARVRTGSASSAASTSAPTTKTNAKASTTTTTTTTTAMATTKIAASKPTTRSIRKASISADDKSWIKNRRSQGGASASTAAAAEEDALPNEVKVAAKTVKAKVELSRRQRRSSNDERPEEKKVQRKSTATSAAEPTPASQKTEVTITRKSSIAAAAMFEKAAAEASKPKKSAGRKSIATIAASSYRSRAASMFEQAVLVEQAEEPTQSKRSYDATTLESATAKPTWVQGTVKAVSQVQSVNRSVDVAEGVDTDDDAALFAAMEAELGGDGIGAEDLADLLAEDAAPEPTTLVSEEARDTDDDGKDDDEALFAAAEAEFAATGASVDDFAAEMAASPDFDASIDGEHSRPPSEEPPLIPEEDVAPDVPAEDAPGVSTSEDEGGNTQAHASTNGLFQMAAPSSAVSVAANADAADDEAMFAAAAAAAELEAADGTDGTGGISEDALFSMIETPETTPAPAEEVEVPATQPEPAPAPATEPALESKEAVAEPTPDRKPLSPVKKPAGTANRANRANRTPARTAKVAAVSSPTSATDADAEGWREQRRLKNLKRAEVLAAKEKELEEYRQERQKARDARKAARAAAMN